MPGPHTESIAALQELDRLDQELLALRAEAADTPAGLAARAAEIQAAAEARAAIASELAAVEAKQRDAERELNDIERRTERANKRMSALTSAEQIAATERELSQLAELQDEVEGTVLELMEETDGLGDRLTAAIDAIGGAERQLGEDESTWELRAAVVEGRIGELVGAIDVLRPTIDKEAMKAYTIGFENRRNRSRRGVTYTEGIMCTMCRTEAPARWVNEARNGDGIHRCLGCKRVLVGAAETDDAQDVEEPA